MTEVSVSLELNGDRHDLQLPTNELLVDTIRSRFGLTGTKVGCDQGACGACTVLVAGDPTASCSTFAWQADGAAVTTIEGLAQEASPGEGLARHGDQLSVEQAAFAAASSFQCGYCTPGMIMSTAAMLAHHPEPDRETIVSWLDANICRCTGYLMIVEAVEAAARNRAAGGGP